MKPGDGREDKQDTGLRRETAVSVRQIGSASRTMREWYRIRLHIPSWAGDSITTGCAGYVQKVVAVAMSTPRGRAWTTRREPGPGMDGRRRIGVDLVSSVSDRIGCGPG